MLTWGLFQRGIGLVLLISFTSLSFQVLAAGGSKTLLPVERRLAKLSRDFPTWRRFFYFPSLLWLAPKDWMLRALTLGGIIAALAVIYGGPYSVWALGVCYVCYLSLDLVMGLVLPWDTLLLETTVLSLFLPATHSLPNLEAVAVPAPALTWAFRLLVFRVMFGFGKQKFLGSRRQDMAYLKGFFLNQPLLSPGGWYAHYLPMWILRLSVLFMFFVEIPAPFFAFFPGWPSIVCAVSTIFLMGGIQATGNFGYFSLLTMVVSIPLFDNQTPTQLHLFDMFGAGQPVVTNAFVLAHTLCALLTFPFNSWLAQGWHLWAVWYQLPRWAMLPIDFIRTFHPFRWVHPYGVFPPNTTPSVKITALAEVTWDERTWHELNFKFAPSNARSAPHFVAPHHPRGEQAIIYDTFGVNYASLLTAVVPAWDPSPYAWPMPGTVFCQAVLRTDPREYFKNTPLADRSDPPLAARVTTVMLEPATIKHKHATGEWWKRTYIGPHAIAQRVDPDFADYMLGEPELWHFDAIFWRRRSSLAPLMRAAREGKADPLELARLNAPEISAADVDRFFDELVPMFTDSRGTFDSLPEKVQEFHQRFDRRQRRIFHRVLQRLSLVLIARLEPLFLHRGFKPLIPVKTYLNLWMLTHYVIGCGRDAYLAAVADPISVTQHVPQLTVSTGLYALSLFRFDEMCFDAQKMRLLYSYFHPHDPVRKREQHEMLKSPDLHMLPPGQRKLVEFGRRVAGMFEIMPHLRDNFRGPAFERGYPELYPEFKELETGEVVIGAYREADEHTVLAPDIKSVRRKSNAPVG